MIPRWSQTAVYQHEEYWLFMIKHKIEFWKTKSMYSMPIDATGSAIVLLLSLRFPLTFPLGKVVVHTAGKPHCTINGTTFFLRSWP